MLVTASIACAASVQPPVVGLWWTQDREGVIAIAPCGGVDSASGAPVMCGTIVGQIEPIRPDGSRAVDIHGVPHCGLRILHDAHQEPDGTWRGRITNPDDGTDWRCEFRTDGAALLLRGYILVPLLGQTQVWTAYHGTVSPECHLG
jgi:uncharacterized protein (DUF2147 family)